VTARRVEEAAALIVRIEAGEEASEGELVRAVRRASCPARLVELLVHTTVPSRSRRLLPLLLRHPACPRHFALESLPRLGWHDLLDVARDPRTAPAVRRQSERKLTERLQTLTLGERAALARLAPRSIVLALLTDDEPVCVEALLTNAQFTENEALRLLQANHNPACLLVLLRHPAWGSRSEVLRAAVRSDRIPLGVAFGLVAALPETELERVAIGRDARPRIREAAQELLGRRRTRPPRRGAPLALR
jgi:hypothetical protein